MTTQQAVAEFKRLLEGLGGNVNAITAEERRSWMRVLEALPYERGRAAVTELIDTWEYNSFPRPGKLAKVAETMTFDGQPNAGAYSQDRPPTLYDPERMRRAIEQHDQWLAMTDEEYLDELERLQLSGAIKVNGG